MPIRSSFDEAYYERFYGGARERRAYFKEERLLGDFVCAYLKYIGQPVRNVIDIGCGLGQWQDIVKQHFPRASYTGVETSEYLCDRYGWTRGSVVDFRSQSSFDLVICKDTLQYLSAGELASSVAGLAQLCRGALYASVLTQHDWETLCDRRLTDRNVYLRTATWYRKRLGRHFTNLGGSLFLSPHSPASPWEIETLPVGTR